MFTLLTNQQAGRTGFNPQILPGTELPCVKNLCIFSLDNRTELISLKAATLGMC